MCKVLILLFIIITFIKNPENAPSLLALDHHLPLKWAITVSWAMTVPFTPNVLLNLFQGLLVIGWRTSHADPADSESSDANALADGRGSGTTPRAL